MTERIVSPTEQQEETEVRTTLRPLLLDEFVGQGALKKPSYFYSSSKKTFRITRPCFVLWATGFG